MRYYETTEIRQIAEQVRTQFRDTANIADITAALTMINKGGWKVTDEDGKPCYVALVGPEMSMVLDLAFNGEG